MKISDRASLREKICFGLGSISYCVEMILVLTYLMLFCTDVLMIDVMLIGAVMSVVKILDAISDIIVTNLADKTNTKWGKYRPLVLFGIPLAIMLVLLFIDPAFLHTEKSKILWICGIYILLVPVLETSFTCPYMAMIVTMSENPKDRLDFSMSRALGEAGAQIIVSSLVMPLILYFGGGDYRNIDGWRAMTLVIGAIIIICTLICFFGTKERMTVSNQNEDGTEMKMIEKFRTLKGNKPFWKLIGIIVLFMAHFYASSALFSFFCIHNLGHEEWMSSLLSIGFALQIVVTVLLFYLGRRFEKRTLMIVGGICIIIANVILFMAKSYTMAAAYQILLGIGNGIFNGVAFAALPDVTDYTEWKTGKALPGMISAVATFAMKMGGAGSTLLASLVLSLANYEASLTVQSDATLNMIRLFFPLLSLICLGGAFILSLTLKEISGDKLETYRKEIDARKAETAK